jgi:hypothetical protein
VSESVREEPVSQGRSVGGRQFVHVLDDTKDRWADRTPDLGFPYLPERTIGLKQWLGDLLKIVRAYAKAHNAPVTGLAPVRLEE